MPKLSEVFDLVHRFHANGVKLNVETKVEAGAPTRDRAARAVRPGRRAEIRKAHIARQMTIQSFDWGSLMRMRQVAPELPLVALTNYDFLEAGNRASRRGWAVSTSMTSVAIW